jgi:16S rRNA (cytosine967-C5)-methyltransferase
VRELAREGQIHIQDEASQLVAEIAKPGPGDLVLDVCSAPGGKTTQMAAMAHDEALIVAGDLYQHRLRTVVALAARHHLKSVRAVALNGLSHLPFTEQAFDCVLLDAPCSGTGTLRRNPEIRWRIIPADIADLAERQRDLIWNAAQMVRTGGRLVYSTCSLEPEENEEVVALFLKRDPSFRCVPAEVSSGLSLPSGAVRTWPHRHDSDGFFVAMLQRQ